MVIPIDIKRDSVHSFATEPIETEQKQRGGDLIVQSFPPPITKNPEFAVIDALIQESIYDDKINFIKPTVLDGEFLEIKV